MRNRLMRMLIAVGVLSVASCMVTAPVVNSSYYAIPDDYPPNSVDPVVGERYEGLLAQATAGGYPGFAMLIDGPDGFWAGAGGLADRRQGL